ncbi:SF3a splicing factor complex subunit [Dimargaris xerosporica]|nr:SF3a splicing factor complex subunit [Dimargaris xerosporica]
MPTIQPSTTVDDSYDAPNLTPPPDFEFTADLPAITAHDLDVIKLTAQFVATNGRQFMTSLLQREQGNHQFAFLRPNHSLFRYFIKLVDQYTKVAKESSRLLPTTESDAASKFNVLDRVMQRVSHESHVQEERQKAAEQAFAAIDWHDFVVVGTIEFGPEDEQYELPRPMKLSDLQTMTLAQKQMTEHAETITQEKPTAPGKSADAIDEADMDVDMDVEMDIDEDEGPSEPEPPVPPPMPAPVKPINIKKDYVPRARSAATVAEPTQLCPRCNQAIPVSEMEEHMRIELLDPKWKDYKEAAQAKHKTSNLISGSDMAQNLKTLSGHRQDIFGPSSDDPTVSTTGASQELPTSTTTTKERVIWDGHSASIARATQQARQGLTQEELAISRQYAQGAIPDLNAPKIGPQVPPTAPGDKARTRPMEGTRTTRASKKPREA